MSINWHSKTRFTLKANVTLCITLILQRYHSFRDRYLDKLVATQTTGSGPAGRELPTCMPWDWDVSRGILPHDLATTSIYQVASYRYTPTAMFVKNLDEYSITITRKMIVMIFTSYDVSTYRRIRRPIIWLLAERVARHNLRYKHARTVHPMRGCRSPQDLG